MKNNCVFIVNTIFQGLIAAYMIEIIGKGNNIFIFDATVDGDFLRGPSCFPDEAKIIKLFDDVKNQKSFFKQLSNANKIFDNKIKSVKNINYLYIFNDPSPVEANFAKKTKITGGVVYFIEEGLSAYRRIEKFSLENIKGVVKRFFAKAYNLDYKINFGHSKYFDFLFLRDPEEFNRCFPSIDKKIKEFNITFNSFIINRKFINRFYSSGILEIKYPALLYLGQPLSESNFLETKDELSVILGIKDLCDSCGVNFYIKSHPRELSGKYKFFDNVIDSEIPIEIISSMFCGGKTALISPFSSANYNLFNSEFSLNIHVFQLFGLKIDVFRKDVYIAKNHQDLKNQILLMSNKCT